MGSVIRNSIMAAQTINSLNKNLRAKEKAARHLSLGELVGSAGDDASKYSIGEKMKVRIRALGQDHNNVQNGAALLHVAEGGIQRQIDILREVKAKVIDAANDTNTESDRQTIQKEINQSWQEIDAIAAETEYNGIKVLHGVDTLETIKSWNYLSTADLLPGSDDMGIVPDKYATLDGKVGPFDVFADYERKDSEITSLGLSSVNSYTKVPGTANTHTLDFSGFTSVNQLEGVSFQYLDLRNNPRSLRRYVFTTDPTKNWPAVAIDIRDCSTISDVIKKMASMSYDSRNVGGSTDKTFSFQVPNIGEVYNRITDNVPTGYAQKAILVNDGAPPTGLLAGQTYFTGGKATYSDHAGDPDAGETKYVQATFSLDISNVADGTGLTVHAPVNPSNITEVSITASPNNRVTYDTSIDFQFKFVDGNQSPSWNESYTCLTIGKNATVKGYALDIGSRYNRYAYLVLNMDHGNMTLEANLYDRAELGNQYYVTDGIATNQIQYEALTSFTAAGGKITNDKTGKDSAYLYDLDVSRYTNDKSLSNAEALITELVGKAVQYWMKAGNSYEIINFYDSATAPKTSSLQTVAERYVGMKYFDLDELRNAVKNGSTIADALADWMDQASTAISTTKNADGHVTDIVFQMSGHERPLDSLTVQKATFRHYDLDYGTWFQNNAAKLAGGVASYLDGKGFRAYCASDSAEWFNFAFHNGAAEDRPTNNFSDETIRTIDIDVSDVTDASSLVKAIYEQAEPQLVKRNHYMYLAADYDTGILTLYDDRRYKLYARDWPDLQEKGAKIADGCYYNPLEGFRYTHGKNFIIQHTDKADFNIRLTIPRTTMNEIFGYDPAVIQPEDYNVLTKENREMLLGKQGGDGKADEQGKLDEGIEYLLSAITLVGAQTKRLEYADANIITDQESTTASESAIRDADMAKEMTQYTKANVLAQAAQSMLAQANQQNENLLDLLP